MNISFCIRRMASVVVASGDDPQLQILQLQCILDAKNREADLLRKRLASSDQVS